MLHCLKTRLYSTVVLEELQETYLRILDGAESECERHTIKDVLVQSHFQCTASQWSSHWQNHWSHLAQKGTYIRKSHRTCSSCSLNRRVLHSRPSGNPHDCCAPHLVIYFGSIWTAANKKSRSHTVKAIGCYPIQTSSPGLSQPAPNQSAAQCLETPTLLNFCNSKLFWTGSRISSPPQSMHWSQLQICQYSCAPVC